MLGLSFKPSALFDVIVEAMPSMAHGVFSFLCGICDFTTESLLRVGGPNVFSNLSFHPCPSWVSHTMRFSLVT